MQGKLIITTKKGTVIEEELVVHLDEDLTCDTLGSISGEYAKKLKDGQTIEVEGRSVRLTLPCPSPVHQNRRIRLDPMHLLDCRTQLSR